MELEKSKATQAKFFDRGSKERSTLKKGDVVRMKLPNSAQWSKGEVLGGAGKRSYQVNVDGSVYRRNRRQLIQIPEPREEPEVSSSFPVCFLKNGCNDVYYTCMCITLEFNISMRAPLQ